MKRTGVFLDLAALIPRLLPKGEHFSEQLWRQFFNGYFHLAYGQKLMGASLALDQPVQQRRSIIVPSA
jgi:hypothetical protein